LFGCITITSKGDSLSQCGPDSEYWTGKWKIYTREITW